MGKYSILEDPRVDGYIDRYLESVVEAFFESIPRSYVRSIILGGSFGKGEGSVVVDDQGVKPLRDFDLCIIFRGKIPPKEFIKSLQKKLEHRFCSVTDSDYHLMGDLIPEISVTMMTVYEQRDDYGSNALRFAEEHDWSVTADQVMEVYRRLL